MPVILSPDQWGARVDYDTWNDPYTPDDGVALHHGGGGDYAAANPPYSVSKEISQLRAWEAFHIDGRGWRGLAYGWAVGQTGTGYRVRGFNTYGAHTGDFDGDGIANNAEIVPILWIASGNYHIMTPEAAETVNWLRREVIEPKAPRAVRLYGHQEVSLTADGRPKTSCPGPRGMAYVTTHRYSEGEDMTQGPTAEQIASAVWNHGHKVDENGNEIRPSAYQYQIRTYGGVQVLLKADLATDADVEAAAAEIIAMVPPATAKLLGEKLIAGVQ